MPVEKFSDEISRIRHLLSENPEGLTIKSISEILQMNRNSAAKNLKILQMQGRVTLKQIGAAKIYCPANKLPADAVLKLSHNGVLVISKGDVVVDINETFRELLHLEKDSVIGKSSGQLPFFIESRPELFRLIRDGLKDKEGRVSADLALPNRSLKIMLTVCPVFFENGDPGVALITDIPKETRYPKLNENYLDISVMEEDMTEYICRFTSDGTFTYVNKAYGDLLQKEKADLIGHTWRPTIPENEYNKIKKCLKSLDPVHPVALLDCKVITQSGNSRWQRWTFRMISSADGQRYGYQGTGSDITDLKIFEENARKDAEERENLVRENKVAIQELNKQIYNEIASHEKTHFQLRFTQFAMDNASYLILWVNRGGWIVYANKETQEVLGYPYNELMRKKFRDIVAGGFPIPWDEIWGETLRGRHYELESEIITYDNRRIPVEIVLDPLEFKRKQYYCCFAKDATEKKLAEGALRDSEKKYRDIFEKSVSGLFKTTPEGLLTDVNDTFAHMYGYPGAAEMLQANLDINKHLYAIPDDRKEVRRITDRQGKIENYETLQLKRDGTVFWISITARCIRDKAGAVLFYEGTITNVTDRKRAEAALKESEQKYRTLFENIPDKIFTKDLCGAYMSCNAHYARSLGISIEEIVGKTDDDFYPHQQAEQYLADDLATIGAGATRTIEEMRMVHGIETWVSLLKTPIRDEAGNISGILGIFHDITRRKQEEEEIRNKNRKVLEATSDSLVRTTEDLQLHQAELEVQNEELRNAKYSLGLFSERYFELYDLSPAGYITLSEKGLITSVNLTAATMLGVERYHLVKNPVTRFIIPKYLDIFYGCRKTVIETQRKQSCELRMLHFGSPPVPFQVIAVLAPVHDGEETVINMMLIDIPPARISRYETV